MANEVSSEVSHQQVWKPPYPWFGGKSMIAAKVWQRFGDVRNFVDPFFGSNAILYHRPQPFEGTETVNDADGFLANFWRATKHDPVQVADWADWPVNENDLHARHIWLVGQRESIVSRLEGDPDWFDAKIAGWWVWGQCCWIGGGWCSGKGPWHVVDGELVKVDGGDAGHGVMRHRVHLNRGHGIMRQIVHLGNSGCGCHRKRVSLAPERGLIARSKSLCEYIVGLSERMRNVRVCCGDWKRVCGSTPTVQQGLTAVFLDPPYADTAGRDSDLYSIDSLSVAHDVREWAIEHGDDPRLRIALCGYEGEHKMPSSWKVMAWKAQGGMANMGNSQGQENRTRERVWFSPHCLNVRKSIQQNLFD